MKKNLIVPAAAVVLGLVLFGIVFILDEQLPAGGVGLCAGLGGALIALCGARVVPGIDLMLDVSAFDRLAGAADLILTGEGRLDYQSSFGKAVYGVCTRAKAVNPHCRVIALCGSLGEGYARS